MPTQRLSMRRIREVLRLRHVQGLTERAIAHTLGVSNGVVHGYLRRARLAGLSWPLPEGLSDTALEALLFVRDGPAAGVRRIRLSTLGFLQYLNPTITLLLATLGFGETFTRADMLAFGFVWVALVIVSLDSYFNRVKPLSNPEPA